MHKDLQRKAKLIEQFLKHYGVAISIVRIVEGPAIVRFEIKMDPYDLKAMQVLNSLSENLMYLLRVVERPEIVPLYKQGRLAIDIVASNRKIVYLTQILTDATVSTTMRLPVTLGVDVYGKTYTVDLHDLPHLLIAGTTGSGKSVGLRSIITSLLYYRRNVKFVLIDPKSVELSVFNQLPKKNKFIKHIIVDHDDAIYNLQQVADYVEGCYTYLAQNGVQNIFQLKETIEPIVIVIDELADLMMSNKAAAGIVLKIAQKARAAGVHIVAATQRPSVDVMSGTIKNNFVGRIAFKVGSAIDSRTILGTAGAENLYGNGDMLFKGNSGEIVRLQGAFVDDTVIQKYITESVV